MANTASKITPLGVSVVQGSYDEVTYSSNPNNTTDSKNLFTFSQDFSRYEYWLTGGGANQPINVMAKAPDGSYTASVWEGTGQYPNITKSFYNVPGIFVEPGEIYTYSVYVKYINQTRCTIVQENSWPGSTYAIFDIQNGTIISSGTLTGATITSAGNGWYRCTATFTVPARNLLYTWDYFGRKYLNFNPQLRIGNYDGTNYSGSRMYIWGFQLEEGPTATAYQATSGPRNHLKWTQDINNADSGNGGWFTDNSYVVKDVTTAPDGTMTAEAIVSSITGGANQAFVQEFHYWLINNTNYTYSVYVKQGTSPTTLVDMYNSDPYNEIRAEVTWGNTPTCAFTTGNGGVIVASAFTPVGDGWYRVSLTINTINNVGGVQCRVYVTGQGSNNVAGSYTYMWGAQLEVGSVATEYVKNEFNIKKINKLTYNHNSNFLTYSNDFVNSAWVKNQANIGTTNNLAPDGTYTATKLLCTSDATTQYHYISHNISVTTAQQYTFSAYVKAAEFTGIGLWQNNGSNGSKFDLSAGTNTFNDTGVSSRIVPCGNGWYRISISYYYTFSGTTQVRLYLIQNGTGPTTFIGDGTSGVYIWGAQAEYGGQTRRMYTNLGTIDAVPKVKTPAKKIDSSAIMYVGDQFDEVTYNRKSATLKNMLVRGNTTSSYVGTNDWYSFCSNGNTSNITYNTNDLKAPDGTFSATKVVRNNVTACGANTGWGFLYDPVYNNKMFTPGVTYTCSVWARASTGTISFWLGANDYLSTTYTATSDWQRFTYTFTPTAENYKLYGIQYLSRGIQYYTTVQNVTIYFWGAQVEVGPVATDYQAIGAANTIVKPAFAERITANGSSYVSYEYDEFTKILPVSDNSLILNLDPAVYDSYPESGNTWFNLSSKNYNGTFVNNTPDFSLDNGGVIRTTGRFGLNQYANTTLPSTTFTPTSNKTFSIWVKFSSRMKSLADYHSRNGYVWGQVAPIADNTYGSSGVLLGNSYYGGYGLTWYTYRYGGVYYFGIQSHNRVNSPYQESSPSYDITPFGNAFDRWYNITSSYSSSLNSHVLYLNGVSVYSTTTIVNGNSFSFNSPTINIGLNSVPGGNSMDCTIDGDIGQTLIYNRALTATEVLQNYNATKGRYGL